MKRRRATPPPIDPRRVRTVPLGRRPSKVAAAALGQAGARAGSACARLLDGLPDILAARDLRDAAAPHRARDPRAAGPSSSAWARIRIKVGLGPLIVDLIERGRARRRRHERRLPGARLRARVGRADVRGRRPGPRPRPLRHGARDRRVPEPRHHRGRRRGHRASGAPSATRSSAARLPHRRTSILAAAARAGMPGDRARRDRHRHHPHAPRRRRRGDRRGQPARLPPARRRGRRGSTAAST